MPDIILRRFANREYRLSLQSINATERKGGDKSSDRKLEEFSLAVVTSQVLQQNLDSGLMVSDPSEGGRIFALEEWDIRRGIRALDVIDEFQRIARTRRVKGGWGFKPKPTQFTRNARHRLLEAGAVVDSEFGKNCYEVTLTLPGSGHEAYQTLANWSGWICNRLLRGVRNNSVVKHWFYVWERQCRGALHLHFAIAGSVISEVKKVAQSLEYEWFEVLLELEKKTNVELFRRDKYCTHRNNPERWQSHVAPIRKSCAAYFSKYAGKSVNTKPTNEKSYYPSRWWGSSSAIKAGIKLRRHEYRFRGSNADIMSAYAYLRDWLENPGLVKSYSYEFDLGKSKLGNPLGGGVVQISYYTDESFIRMQAWESYVVKHIMNGTDVPLESIPIPERHTPSPTPLNQHSSCRGKLRSTRGTQAEPTLVLRARLLQYLAGGVGGVISPNAEFVQELREFKQLELQLGKNYGI